MSPHVGIHVVGYGARTPVGLTAPPSAAAVRAELSRIREHPFFVDGAGEPLLCAYDSRLDPRLMGADRMLALAEPALREAIAPLAAAQASRLPVTLYLALPEIRPGFSKREVDRIRSGLERLDGLPFKLARVEPLADGHAGGLAALEKAFEDLQGGAREVCLVGGVESYLQPDTIEWLDGNRQLLREGARSAFPPGEAAGFCLVASDSAVRHFRWSSRARVRAVGVSRETKLIRISEVCVGKGLTSAVRGAVRGLPVPTEKISDIYCDINGERYRSEEWAFVCLQLPTCFDDPAGYRSPARSWGDVGAASGALFTSLACEAAARRYASGRHALLWASSEGGLRATAHLET